MREVPSSLHEDVAQQLRTLIFDGALKPGALLDEPALCAQLSISRTPLREALKVLTAEGLLRHEPRRGCFVAQISSKDLDDIFPVMALLEGRCAYEATLNASAADLLVLEGLHQKLQAHAQAERIQDYYDTNYVIHEAIIRLADNRWLTQLITDLRKILRLVRLHSLQASGRTMQSLNEHLAVFEAMKARDCEAAEAAMRVHLMRQREALRELAEQERARLIGS